MEKYGFRFQLPAWVETFLAGMPLAFPEMESRMELAIELARRNVGEKTGGPFGAAVFDGEGVLVSCGVNLVESHNCSVLHAEVVAIALAQQRLGRYDIGAAGSGFFELVASTEPCAMCFGAVHWSGVARLVCGARDQDARAIGFDEGPKLPDWSAALEKNGIEVVRDVLRAEAAEVLRRYQAEGGTLYNAGRTLST